MLVHNGGGVYLFALRWCIPAPGCEPGAAVVQAGAPAFNASSNAAAGIGRAYR